MRIFEVLCVWVCFHGRNGTAEVEVEVEVFRSEVTQDDTT